MIFYGQIYRKNSVRLFNYYSCMLDGLVNSFLKEGNDVSKNGYYASERLKPYQNE